MATWKKRTDWLATNFITTSKGTKEALEQMVRFANGDSSSNTAVVHWCLTKPQRNCCESDEESMCKFLSHAVPFFSTGFQTPLLYRMKGYGPASSWVKFGCLFFNILPKALQEMESSEPSSDIASVADAFLAENGLQSVAGEDADFQQILADALDRDQNYSYQNKVRRNLITQEINKSSFWQSSMVIDALIQPIEHGVNYLLGHTKILHDLHFLGRGHPKRDELKEKARTKFLHVVTGALGDALIGNYISFLETGLKEAVDMGLEATPDLLNKVFNLVTVCVTDLHRRFNHELASYPFRMFLYMQLFLYFSDLVWPP